MLSSPQGKSMNRSAFLFAAGCILFSVVAAAQEPSRGPDGRASSHVSGVEVLAIPGEPFSAKDTIDWIRTLEDGSTVSLHLDAFLARDSQGRIYRERHNFVPSGSKDAAPLYEIHLYDPVTRTQLLCNGRTYQCTLFDYVPRTFFESTPEGTYDHESRTLTREHLGADTIEGIYVLGTRETMTISAGTVGNERPMVSTREFWYSNELQTNLAVTRVDPAEGKQIIRLSKISRSAPDPHLWDIPIGFTVRDIRGSATRRK
jgi:hypothetical protein